MKIIRYILLVIALMFGHVFYGKMQAILIPEEAILYGQDQFLGIFVKIALILFFILLDIAFEDRRGSLDSRILIVPIVVLVLLFPNVFYLTEDECVTRFFWHSTHYAYSDIEYIELSNRTFRGNHNMQYIVGISPNKSIILDNAKQPFHSSQLLELDIVLRTYGIEYRMSKIGDDSFEDYSKSEIEIYEAHF